LRTRRKFWAVVAAAAVACAAAGLGQAGAVQQHPGQTGGVQRDAGQTGALGIFESQADIGQVNPPGTASFDAASGIYTVASAGWDLWAVNDAFHMVWKKVSGDLSLTADIRLAAPPAGSHRYRKAFLMFRQTLDPDSMYADVAVHGSGETALQYRQAKGDTTQDISFDLGGTPKTVRLEKRGDTITLFVSLKGETLHQVGAATKLHFAEPFLVGLGVCSHRDGALEKAAFSDVELKPLSTQPGTAPMALYSTLQTIPIDNNYRRAFVVLTGKGQMEAPNWSRDGKTLIFDRGGQLWTVPATGGEARRIDTGGATHCSGSHGLSPDGKWLAMTCNPPDHPGWRVYIIPSGGGAPRLLTGHPDSWFHSWSPDGKTILFVRPANGSYNICAIPADGGDEKALTTGTGTSDDPDFSADGQYIYFNSDRAGGMQIFRMRPDGSRVEQMTFDDRHNWTAHPSPDGKSVLILSYAKDVTGHQANQDVTLRILDVPSGKVRDLVAIVGGAGTDNVPNWAPDGAHFAFVSYQMLPDDGVSQ